MTRPIAGPGSVTRFLAVTAAAEFVVAMTVFGLLRTDYSHVRQTISELGEFGSAHSAAVSWGVFLPVGLAALAVGLLQLRSGNGSARYAAAALGLAIAAGYIVAAFFPCDPGSPLEGSARQRVHNLGGAVEYIGGAVALFALAWLAPRFRVGYGLAALVVSATAIAISVEDWFAVRGLVQRVGEAALFGSLILTSNRR